MIGITAYGGYVPFYRLSASTANEAFGKKGGKTERAVAYYDEDSTTMAVAASLGCLKGDVAEKLDAVYFASTTSPYREKMCAADVAAAIDAKKEVRLADYANSLRASTAAMLGAVDAAKAGQITLVAAGDCRLGGADGPNEIAFGDAAAAFVIGNEKVLAELVAHETLGINFMDTWRSDSDKIVRNWDVRYAQSLGYEPQVKEITKKILGKTGLVPSDFSKIVLYAHEKRHQTALASKLGFTPEQVQDAMYAKIGNTGCAAAPLMLVTALEEAKPDDKILYITYGEGCDAMIFSVTEEIAAFRPETTVADYIAYGSNDLTYGKYLKWKHMIPCEPQKRPDQERSSLSDYFRNYKKNNALYGSRCKCCGTPQFPPQRICANCKALDQMEPYSFRDKNATIATFTVDGLSLSLDSPNILVVVEFEGGGKMMTYLVDCKKEDIHVNMPVKATFRQLFEANGVHTYFWKVAPKREGGNC